MNRCGECFFTQQVAQHAEKAKEAINARIDFAKKAVEASSLGDDAYIDIEMFAVLHDLLDSCQIPDDNRTLAERLEYASDDIWLHVADYIIVNMYGDDIAKQGEQMNQFSDDVSIVEAWDRIHAIPYNLATCAGECSLLYDSEFLAVQSIIAARDKAPQTGPDMA